MMIANTESTMLGVRLVEAGLRVFLGEVGFYHDHAVNLCAPITLAGCFTSFRRSGRLGAGETEGGRNVRGEHWLHGCCYCRAAGLSVMAFVSGVHCPSMCYSSWAVSCCGACRREAGWGLKPGKCLALLPPRIHHSTA